MRITETSIIIRMKDLFHHMKIL